MHRWIIVLVSLLAANLGSSPAASSVAEPSRAHPGSGAAVSRTGAAEGANLVLVTIDTLRADRLAAYGYPSVATPHLDRLAREGVLFEQVATTTPLTLPSHASILTGQYPFAHGVRDNVNFRLAERFLTLPEILGRAGYATGGFIGARVLAAASGIAQGFDVYTDVDHLGSSGSVPPGADIERRADEVVDDALAWIGRREGKFFAWVHLFDPHLPYGPPPPFDALYEGREYDGEVAYVDQAVGRLVDGLESHGVSSNTVIAVTSDHGEGLGDHGERRHSVLVYDSTTRVPLIVWAPGRLPASTRVAGQASVVDIMPTVLGLLEVDDPDARQRDGRDLQDLVDNPAAPGRPAYIESLVPLLELGWSEVRALRTGDVKFIAAPRPELYELATDPGETTNIADTRTATTTEMRARLEAMIVHDDVADLALGLRLAGGLSEQHVAALLSLGYVGSAVASSGGARLDPKDHVATAEGFQDDVRFIAGAIAAQRWDAVSTGIVRLEARVPGHPLVNFYRGRSRLRQGNPTEAVADLEQALEWAPANTLVWLDLAAAHRQLGNHEKAYELLQEGARSFPEVPNFEFRRGGYLREDGKLREAVQALNTARRIAPDDAAVLRQLASAHAEANDARAAREVLMRLVQVTPESSDAWTGLASVLCRLEEWAACEGALRAAIDTAPDLAQPYADLGRLLIDRGRRDEALDLFRKTLQIDRAHAVARRFLTRFEPR